MASRYYYERPVEGYRPPYDIRDGRAPYYDPSHVAFQERDPRHHASPSYVPGAPAATSTYDDRHGAQAVHDPFRRDWRDQDRGISSTGRPGVVPAEEVHAHPNAGGWNGHDGRRPQMPARNPAHEPLLERKAVSLWMPLCCDKCERKVKEHLRQIDGVENVVADQVTKKVMVVGTMRPEHVLSRARQDKPNSKYWSDYHGY